jgi:hypothetical protein
MPQVIFTVLAPIFFVMALGYVAGRMRTIDNHHVGEINAGRGWAKDRTRDRQPDPSIVRNCHRQGL